MTPSSPAPPDDKQPECRPRRVCRWGFRAWLIALGIVLLGGLWIGRAAHPFFAPSRPVETKILVVEGWLPDYALEVALREFHRGGYERIFTTGGPLEHGSFLREYHSYAELAAATLQQLGAPTNQVIPVPSEERYRNRTFAAAVALKEYCVQREIPVPSLNLISLGAHSRRSGLCFSRAFRGKARVGILSIENKDYDPRRWWRYSAGVKTVLGETIGFAYAWLAADYGD